MGTFLRFLARRFLDDRCPESAAVLAYTSIFAVVPLLAVVFAVLAVFPVFDLWTQQLVDLVFTHFVPEAAATIADTLANLAGRARQLGPMGLAALLVSMLLTLLAIERSFDRIWRVKRPRPPLRRLLMYWAVLSLGVLLAAASLAASTWIFGSPGWADPLTRLGQGLLPGLAALLVFSLAYRWIPNHPVPWSHALAGGLLAALLFELAKAGFAAYLVGASLESIYGAVAVLPIFLLWVWLSWLVLLLGASFAASLSAFRHLPKSLRLPAGAELYAGLRLLARLEHSRSHGRGLDPSSLRRLEPWLDDALLQRLLAGLTTLDLVRPGLDGAWLPVRDLSMVTIGEFCRGLGLGMPPANVVMPGAEDELGRAILARISSLRPPVDAFFGHALSTVLDTNRTPG